MLASAVVALGAAGRPTGAGVAFVAVQAAAVAGLTVAQVRAVRDAHGPVAAAAR